MRREATGMSKRENSMIKNFLVWLLTAILLTAASVTDAQQQANIAKIGELRSQPRVRTRSELILQTLRDLGYVAGKNIAFETRYHENKREKVSALAEELVRLKVDVLLGSSANELIAFKNATTTIPIVFYTQVDPVAAGLVDSLARPGGNITGFTAIGAVLAGKRLELLKETIPKLSRVALLWNPMDTSSVQQWRESQLEARGLGLQLHSMEVSSAEKYEAAFKEAALARSQGLALAQDSISSGNQKQIVELAAKFCLPAIYGRGDFVESGGFMSYGADRIEPYRRAAVLVDKILKGTKPPTCQSSSRPSLK